MLWIDKYRPKSLKDIKITDSNADLINLLLHQSKRKDIPHLIFYGPNGGGKRTLIRALLNDIFDNKIHKTKIINQPVCKTSKKINKQKKIFDINLLISPYHVEITPSDYGFKDSLVIQQVIKQLATNLTFTHTFKVIVIYDTINLSHQAQKALLRTMEKYQSNCRLILHCENTSYLIEPLKSRCLPIRVGLYSKDEIRDILNNVLMNEKIQNYNQNNLDKIIDKAQRNLEKAIILLERDNIKISYDGYNDCLNYIIDKICNNETNGIMAILEIRKKMYELLNYNISASQILIDLLNIFLDKNDIEQNVKNDIIKLTSYFDYQIRSGSRNSIFHLEAFIAKFILIIKL
jgi:replication factor C subunit 3/5